MFYMRTDFFVYNKGTDGVSVCITRVLGVFWGSWRLRIEGGVDRIVGVIFMLLGGNKYTCEDYTFPCFF